MGMFDVTLHVGIEHPNLLWLLFTAVLSFGAGVTAGWFGRQKTADSSVQAGDGPAADTPKK